ncbi:trypsin-like peptidase domain-containing protein [Imhoffiella purpurea]|uniref:Peptidase S1 domain-containing protein n=1 Tax=Imhoffiella purpurea TaxID=1249627 RepID=W9VXB6_9GAMM|nr:trypsin-like peptidase domain-containing protein [Imhoffiella purpurea]EXJ15075.1 hypothetical protein D779_1629 [Imhoffiella purpurea]
MAVLLLFWSATAAALLGGEPDSDERYAAVIALGDGRRLHCSATKIGDDRFLTAAHCVADTSKGGLDDAFRPGRRLFLSNRVSPVPSGDLLAVTVREVRLHASYLEALRRFYRYKEDKIRDFRERYSGEDLARRIRVVERDALFTSRFPDLAILRVREPTPGIPILPVDCGPLHAGDRVEIVGYGYESLQGMALARRMRPYGRRNRGFTRVIRVDPVNFYSYAGELHSGSPSLSPGDSGGPVLRDGRVVGVNGTVYGLSRLDMARSNMSVNLNGLTGDTGLGCREFFGLPSDPGSGGRHSGE